MAIDQVHDLQEVFRKLLHSMSRPGSISSIQDTAQRVDYDLSCYDATLLCALTLLDGEVTFHILSDKNQHLTGKISEYTLARHAPIDEADYVIVFQNDTESDVLHALERCKNGTLVNPQQSSTWIMESMHLTNDDEIKLNGPGIKNCAHLQTGFSSAIWHARNERTNEYPLGMDLILTDSEGHAACVPRTAKVEMTEVR
ncbi:phosphonate C-P lyase system protein PhnH [Oceanobacillus massiliensis]|uniref:phosphonate C-P lyase system protein PhnH n=1 Tax=Oceanobacillus massiliensis TaxID=1465765 RepID=UPI0002899493|nr:phosphonate C-P lyase system protein PhnH [Oceanobacillus massiliensis]